MKPGTGDKVTGDKSVTIPDLEPAAEPHTGASDRHVQGEVVVHVQDVPELFTAKEYRDKGYAIDPKIEDDEIITTVPSDQYGEELTVTLVDGTELKDQAPESTHVTGQKTPDEVKAEALAKADPDADSQHVVVDTELSGADRDTKQDKSAKGAKKS